jgi:hypothetical protein
LFLGHVLLQLICSIQSRSLAITGRDTLHSQFSDCRNCFIGSQYRHASQFQAPRCLTKLQIMLLVIHFLKCDWAALLFYNYYCDELRKTNLHFLRSPSYFIPSSFNNAPSTEYVIYQKKRPGDYRLQNKKNMDLFQDTTPTPVCRNRGQLSKVRNRGLLIVPRVPFLYFISWVSYVSWFYTFQVSNVIINFVRLVPWLLLGAGTAQWYSAGLLAGWSGVLVLAGARNFSLHHRVQTGSGAHPASYPMGTRGSFPGDKAAGAWS